MRPFGNSPIYTSPPSIAETLKLDFRGNPNFLKMFHNQLFKRQIDGAAPDFAKASLSI
jgi:hypothetical protein